MSEVNPVVSLAIVAGASVGAYFIAKEFLDKEPPDPPPEEDATIEYKTNPLGIIAEMFIDNLSVGFTNNPGPLTVKVKPGYRKFSFGDVSGYVTPEAVSETIEAGKDYTATVTYTKNEGAILVNTTPILAGVSIDGTYIGIAPVYKKVAPGTHMISFSDFEGYNTPPNKSVNVLAGHQTEITATYTVHQEPKGYINVVTAPVQGRIYIDGVESGLAPITKQVFVGSHTVSFGDVADYVTPVSQEVNVTEGATLHVTGNYLPSFGNLHVDTSPVKGEVFVNNVSMGLAPIEMNDIGIGTYHLRFGSVPDHDTPVERDVVVLAGKTTTEVGNYVSWGPTHAAISGIFVYEIHA